MSMSLSTEACKSLYQLEKANILIFMIISSQLTMRKEYYGNWKILQIKVFFSPTLEKLIVKHAPVCYQP